MGLASSMPPFPSTSANRLALKERQYTISEEVSLAQCKQYTERTAETRMCGD